MDQPSCEAKEGSSGYRHVTLPREAVLQEAYPKLWGSDIQYPNPSDPTTYAVTEGSLAKAQRAAVFGCILSKFNFLLKVEISQAKVNSGYDLAAIDTTKALSPGKHS